MVSKWITAMRRLELFHESFGATALAPFVKVDKRHAGIVVWLVSRERDYALVSRVCSVRGKCQRVSA